MLAWSEVAIVILVLVGAIFYCSFMWLLWKILMMDHNEQTKKIMYNTKLAEENRFLLEEIKDKLDKQ